MYEQEDERRLGHFRLGLDLIKDEPEIARAIMAQVIVFEARYRMDLHAIEYLASSPLFAPVCVGCEAPWYIWHLRHVPGRTEKLVSVEPGGAEPVVEGISR